MEQVTHLAFHSYPRYKIGSRQDTVDFQVYFNIPGISRILR